MAENVLRWEYLTKMIYPYDTDVALNILGGLGGELIGILSINPAVAKFYFKREVKNG